RFSIVDLPAPLGPMSAQTDFSGTDSDTLRTARTPPKLLLTLFALNKLDDAAGHEEDDQGERDAVDHEAQLAEAAQQLRQEGEHHGADHRADHRSHAADDDHRQHGERLDDIECVGHQRADEARIEDAGERRDTRADAERERLPDVAAHAERRGGDLVLPNRAQRVTHGRAYEVVHQPVNERADAGDEIEQPDRAADRRQDAVDAAHPLGDLLPVDEHLVGNDRETERRDRQVVPPQPHGEGSQREADHACKRNRGERGQPEVPVVRLDEDRADVGADAEERRLSEVELSRVAHHQVERQREQHVHRAEHEDAAPVRRMQQPRRGGDERDGDPVVGRALHTFSSLRSAMMPVGRTTSMARSSTKTTRSMRPAPKYCTVKASMIPTRMPAMMVPCMLPKPPMMTMANAFTTTDAPAKGV